MITLIRHGATAENLAGQYIGSTDVPLCAETERTLLANAHRYPHAPTLFVSPMIRCRQTASILYPGQAQTILPGLRECDFGAFEGKTYAELRDNPDYQAWIVSGGLTPFPGGEGRAQFCERCAAAFRGATACGGGDAVFVVHGGVIMALMEAFAGGGFYDWQVKPCGGFSGTFLQGRLTRVACLLVNR